MRKAAVFVHRFVGLSHNVVVFLVRRDVYHFVRYHTFAMNNIFTGSKGLFRFRAEPKVVMANPKEVDFAQSAIHVEYWHGLYCYEKSTMEGECTFPMSEEGREEMRRWLEEKI